MNQTASSPVAELRPQYVGVCRHRRVGAKRSAGASAEVPLPPGPETADGSQLLIRVPLPI